MIKPKHSFGKKSFEIKQEFVDRTEAKALYHDKLRNNDKEYNILSYYGIGGIGKSSLRREICRMHTDENTEGIIFYLDLEPADDRNLGMGILKLVDSCNTKIDFRCFQLAYAMYFRKKHPGSTYDLDKDMFVSNTFVGIGLDIIGVFDNGITGTTAEIIERSIRAIKDRKLDKDVRDELKRFGDYSLPEMEERLPAFFQYDLQTYLENHGEARVLILIDTFEALNENVLDKIQKSRNERWIQDLISYFDAETFPNLLTVIFGRDQIDWDDEWMAIIEQYQLNELTDDYSREYLNRAGITDENIVNAITKNSRGYPFLLSLSAELYANKINTGEIPQAEDFKGSDSRIIERFIYNLDKETSEALTLISVPNFYDWEIFSDIVGAFNVAFPFTEYEQFNKYSFVKYDEKEDEYFIHDLMRKGILEHSSALMIRKAHQRMLDYYTAKISEDPITKYVIELFYHARKSKTADEFNSWLDEPLSKTLGYSPIAGLKKLQLRGEQSVLFQIICGVLSQFDINELKIDFVNIYVDIVHLGGDYEKAVDICRSYLGQYSDEAVLADKALLKMRIRKIHHSMFYAPVDNLINEAELLVKNIDPDSFPEEYNELLFLLGGNLGVLSGRFDYASEWLSKSMDYANEHNLDLFVHRNIRKQADILIYEGHVSEAVSLVNTIVSIDTPFEQIDSRYKIYLTGTLGECYRREGDLDKAWKCFDIIDRKSTKNHMPGWQAHSNLGKGMVMADKGMYEEAGQYFDRAYDIYSEIRQQWGIINVLEARLLLKNIQKKSVEREEAEKCRSLSANMGYRYNEQFVDRLVTGDSPYLQLFFL